MAKLFAKHTTADHEKPMHRAGGGGYTPLESGVYKGVIKTAYHGVSTGGATSMTLVIKLAEPDREYRETLWVLNKEGTNFKLDEKKKKKTQQGYVTMDELCRVTTGEPFDQQEFTEKMISVYDYDQKKEVLTAKQVIEALEDLPVTLCIQKQIVDKNELDDKGVYQPTGETRDVNAIVRVANGEYDLTSDEIDAEKDEPVFVPTWKANNEGRTNDRSTKVAATAGTKGRPTPSQAANTDAPASKASSMFKKRA